MVRTFMRGRADWQRSVQVFGTTVLTTARTLTLTSALHVLFLYGAWLMKHRGTDGKFEHVHASHVLRRPRLGAPVAGVAEPHLVDLAAVAAAWRGALG